ncbi:sulfate ABC transporter substrate-binding protein [Lichenihabitans sp. Uapishka_5]|uniref:sulfate ABC transporter substrate-binding protein n=1 Tax=Lichenihabitans sp. Uapishka_5 TaxID=3037302 RepID=UPI0029E81F3E|nr:sulfate ABC transporter substrate-binding protein [Lichenihabitans sp. Uapishka_5]MDX7952917.1 sulfate ABC transporter substrate-binding protein [Lichenihabitans sp. Uapishka_5]
MFTRRHVVGGLGALAAGLAARPALAKDIKLLNVSYDPTRELYTVLNDGFAEAWKQKTGDNVGFEMSHGGSGKQARSVLDGLKADVVTLALGWDVTAIEQAGLIKPGWQTRLPDNASPYTSTVAFLVRKGNPKAIKDWSDLVRPGVEAITASPKTGGGGRWVFLGIWGGIAKAPTFDLATAEGVAAAKQAGDGSASVYANAAAKDFLTTLYNKHVPVLDTGARGATVSFAQKGIGDVLLNWENELYLAREEFGADKFDIVYPSTSILGEPPVAVVDAVVDQKGTRAVAEAYLQYLYTPEAQDAIGQLHYRPRDIAALKKYSASLPTVPMFTIDTAFGGWPKAQATFFKDGALFDALYKPAQ